MEHQVHLNPKGKLLFPHFISNNPWAPGEHEFICNPDMPLNVGDTVRVNSTTTAHTITLVGEPIPAKGEWSAYGFTPVRVSCTTTLKPIFNT